MKRLKKVLSNKYFIFLVAFAIMYIYLLPRPDLIDGSGDSCETIKVIKTFFSSNRYISYVMYKGIYAFLPGLLCYNLAKLINISWLILMKGFHALGFAYITTVGLPHMINYIFKKESNVIQKYIFILLFIMLEYQNFLFVSVDFMSTALLILCINSIIRIERNKKPKLISYLFPGLLLGICTCLSGQFLPSALVLIIYFICLIFKKNKAKKLVTAFLALLVFVSGLALTKGIDKAYNKMVIQPARESGQWLPNGEEWLYVGFTSNMLIINYPRMIPDNLGLSLIESENIDREAIAKGFSIYDAKGMVKLISKYPVLFCIRWTERLYLGIVNDPHNIFGGNVKMPLIAFIIFMSTLIYISLLEFKNNTKKVSDLFSFNTLIAISFILSALVPSFGHVENRYFLAIRTLIIGVFCLSPFLPRVVKSIVGFFKKYNIKNFKEYKLNYNIMACLIFVVISIVLYAAIYQTIGPDVNSMYKFF